MDYEITYVVSLLVFTKLWKLFTLVYIGSICQIKYNSFFYNVF